MNNKNDTKIINNEAEALLFFLKKIGSSDNTFFEGWLHGYKQDKKKRNKSGITFSTLSLRTEGFYIPYEVIKKTLNTLEQKNIIKITTEVNFFEEFDLPCPGNEYEYEGKIYNSTVDFVLAIYNPNINISKENQLLNIMFEIYKLDEDNVIIDKEMKRLKKLGYDKNKIIQNKPNDITFHDGKLITKTDGVIIHSFKAKAEIARDVCDYIFCQKTNNEWVHWDEIAGHITGNEMSESHDVYKQRIYDSVRLINRYLSNHTNKTNTIINDGRQKYKIEF